jgi:hypothetical protein
MVTSADCLFIHRDIQDDQDGKKLYPSIQAVPTSTGGEKIVLPADDLVSRFSS